MDKLFTLASMEFFLIGIVAMFGHALKKWMYNEIDGRLLDWYTTHPKATVGAVFGCVTAIAGAILGAQLTDPNVGAQVLAAAGLGFAADTFNSQGPTQ